MPHEIMIAAFLRNQDGDFEFGPAFGAFLFTGLAALFVWMLFGALTRRRIPFGFSGRYWAPVTTIIVTQSTLGAAWNVSKLRLVGTALGAATGALLASYFNPGIVVLGAGVFVLGLICAVLRLDQSAYRFAGVALAIIVLITRAQSPWITGMHRFVEVSIGIVVGLVFSGIWSGPKSQESRT